ncbi:MAG: hypothetical protein CVV53_03250 [Spirochaetae bacterium HGW-Spirochaetae-9]|nr:MAG: hypothetical protein CVV53_03250 [Spirochaetae bacterium HGW-Spirochaetae-9]
MKKLMLIALLAVVLLAGCELVPKLTFDDVKGEWIFPSITDIKGTDVKDTGLSVMGDSEAAVMLDIRWTTVDTDTYFLYMADGSFEGTTFTGTYCLSGFEETVYEIVVEFSSEDDTITAEFNGEGALNGLIFTDGQVNL